MFFMEIRKNVWNPDSVHPYMMILTHVRINVNPYMGIRTFYGDYCIKMAFFLPFFRISFYVSIKLTNILFAI